MSKKLSEFLPLVVDVSVQTDVDVFDLCIDSRLVKKGDLFIATRGENNDARKFILHAQEKGAAAVVCEAFDPHTNNQQSTSHPLELQVGYFGICAYSNYRSQRTCR